MQRCQFLATIPQTTTADTSRVEEIVEDRSVTDDGTHSITDCSSVLSGLNNVHVTADMNDDPLGAVSWNSKRRKQTVTRSWLCGSDSPGPGSRPSRRSTSRLLRGSSPSSATKLSARSRKTGVGDQHQPGGRHHRGIRMTPDNIRVTPHIVRTEDGETYYEASSGVSYPRQRLSERRSKHVNPTPTDHD